MHKLFIMIICLTILPIGGIAAAENTTDGSQILFESIRGMSVEECQESVVINKVYNKYGNVVDTVLSYYLNTTGSIKKIMCIILCVMLIGRGSRNYVWKSISGPAEKR